MMRIRTTAMAITSKMWMKPPIVYELTIPSAHSTRSTDKDRPKHIDLLSGDGAPPL